MYLYSICLHSINRYLASLEYRCCSLVSMLAEVSAFFASNRPHIQYKDVQSIFHLGVLPKYATLW